MEKLLVLICLRVCTAFWLRWLFCPFYSNKLPGVPETLLKRRKTLEKIRAARAASKIKQKKVSLLDYILTNRSSLVVHQNSRVVWRNSIFRHAWANDSMAFLFDLPTSQNRGTSSNRAIIFLNHCSISLRCQSGDTGVTNGNFGIITCWNFDFDRTTFEW